jgi:triosephosphate isomerase
VATGLALALAACGGDSGNAAVGKAFTYGASVPASSQQTSALDAQVSGALALKSAPDASNAQDVASASDITGALLGNSGMALATASPVQQRLLAVGARTAAAS